MATLDGDVHQMGWDGTGRPEHRPSVPGEVPRGAETMVGDRLLSPHLGLSLSTILLLLNENYHCGKSHNKRKRVWK